MSDENLMGVVTPVEPDAQANAASEAPDTASEAGDGQPEKTFTQADLDKIVQREKAKAERRAERANGELKAQLEKLSESINELRTKPKADAADAAEQPPKRDQFDTYEDFVEAKAEFKALQRVREELGKRDSKAADESNKQQQERQAREFRKATEARIESGRKAYADFDAVLNEAFDDGVIPAGSHLHYALIEDEAGHDLAYHLAKHPEEAERISALSERAMLRELGKLSVKLADKKPSAKQAPIDPVGNRAAPGTALRDDLSTDEWIKRRNAQLRSKANG
jgi:hypothetical protein